MIMVIVGDIDADEVESAIREFFAGFHRRPRAPVVLPTEPTQASPRFGRETGAFNLSRLEWSYHTVPLSHPDTSALDVLAKILGSGRSSRLVRELVEERQLAVSADAWSWTPGENGMFGFSAVFPPENEADLLASIQEQIDAWRTMTFTDEEIQKAQRQILVSELSGLQTAAGQAGDYASGEFYAGDPTFSESYLAGVNRVTAKDLSYVLDRYVRTENRTIVILSPEKEETRISDVSKGSHESLPERIALPGGSTLIVREDHRLPFVYVSVAAGGGLLAESADRAGVTKLMADMLTRGTATRTASEIAEDVESMGARLHPYSGRNSFGLTARCLSEDTEAFADLLADCLIRPEFPRDEMNKQRDIQLAAVRQQMERPMYQAQQQLRDMLFPGHPYRWIPAGTLESVERISREDLVDQHRELVVSSNLVLSIFGDISVEQATRIATGVLKDAPSGPPMTPATSRPDPKLPASRNREEPKEQAIILIGFPGVDVLDPRVDALGILENALSGLSSDLVIEIRDKRGLAYYAGAYQRPGREPGSVVFYAGTRPDVLQEVEGLLEEQIERVSTEGLRDEELSRSRAQLIASHEKGLQDNGRLAQTCALNELYGLGYLHAFKTRERLEAVSPAEIQRAAAELLKPGQKAVSIVVPEAQAEVENR
jgi:zinc protease